ncbi:hypothetical protein FGG08_006449 [Glutinoglossum americanum]|uniref:YTH domain-containing protein n=1 Tax=Glutinoglossum americanum TaxID=1670608 RepID=A0A9P8I592_9PEZI|nr:hypothetical protein FGG08_006449 [Glutinoglossum americanum]
MSEGRPESLAANFQVRAGHSTCGPQVSTKAPAIAASPDIQSSGPIIWPQVVSPSTDPQRLASGEPGSQGPQSFSSASSPRYVAAQTQAQELGGPFSMSDMGRALHGHNTITPIRQQYQPHQQRFPAGPTDAPAPALVYHVPLEMPQLAGQTAMSFQNNPMWPMNHPQYYQTMYQQAPHNAVGSGYPQFVQLHQVRSPGIDPAQSQYPNTPWLPQQQQPPQPPNSYSYSTTPYDVSGQGALPKHSVGSYSTPPYPTPYPRRSSLPPAHQSPMTRPDGEHEGIGPHSGITPSPGYRISNPQTRSLSVPTDVSSSSGSGNFAGVSPGPLHPSILRGPPRKPKQSGHALWVGNLPPGTRIVDLKDHFSRDATADIESVFLISKSNCAFVNYKTEAVCASAMARFHDSRFQGVRLVCRLRRGSATSPASTPAGPTSSAQAASSEYAPTPAATHNSEVLGEEGDAVVANNTSRENSEQLKERYFIVKSLTVEDLDISVQNGTWATQSHNEETLNKAFETSESVYLIFSANKSGEYYGYARMASPISGEPSSLTANWTPRMPIIESSDLPRAIPTPATEYAPKGRIIDDSARGTIFWEADDDNEEASLLKDNQDNSSEQSEDCEDGLSSSKSWGNPFKIEWVSTTRLPFYRTRGLRNPWNANREVKIARDGTELETSVGRRLLMMFHRSTPSPASSSGIPLGAPILR